MSKRQWLMIFGVMFAALPFLGFPSSWDTVFAIILGFPVIALAHSLPAREREVKNGSLPFVEHRNGFAKEPNSPASHSRPEDTITNDNSPN